MLFLRSFTVVTSKSSTFESSINGAGCSTIEGLHEMEAAGVRSALINAVRASADKADALGN